MLIREGQPVTKLSALREFMAAEQWTEALRMAARFGDLGEHKKQITRAWDAIQSPAFYRQLGKDPEALVAEGIAALRARYAQEAKPAKPAKSPRAGARASRAQTQRQ